MGEYAYEPVKHERRPSLKLIGDLVEAGLNAGLVKAWRAGHADAADNVVAGFDGQSAGDGDDARQRNLLADDRIVAGESLGVIRGRGAKAERGIGLAARVLHCVGAGVVAAQGD